MQNKPNVKYVKINISPYMTTKYVKMDTWLSWKNKPNQTQFKPKTNPISKMPKMNVTIYYKKDYSNKTANRRIQNKPNSKPNKPNFKACPERSPMGQFPKGQNELKIAYRKIRPHPLLTPSGNCLTSSSFTNIIHRLLIRLLLCRTFK
jgi:hypothetical protein